MLPSDYCSREAFVKRGTPKLHPAAHSFKLQLQNALLPPRERRGRRKYGRNVRPSTPAGRVVSRASLQSPETEVQLEGIDRNYCDDFVCTSSPQVEQNVKALARDLTRLSTWTTSLFRKDIEYKDAFLSFKGISKYRRLTFPKDAVGDPKVLVTRLRMLDKGAAQIDWRLRGSVAVFPIDVDLQSEFKLDLLTGRVNSHSEKWDLSRLSPPAKLAFLASRVVWSLRVRAANSRDDLSETFKGFSKEEEDAGSNISVDPTDPTKFFQDNSDPTKDLFSVGAIIAFLWLIFQAYSEIEKLKL